MKKIALVFLVVMLSTSSGVLGQPIANALAKNDRGSLPAVVEAREAFLPDRPTFVQQNTVWHGNGDLIGIEDNGNSGTNGTIDNTFICSNMLTNSDANSEDGIVTSFHDGYIKKNTITGTNHGYNQTNNVFGSLPHLVANTIEECKNEGILTQSDLDMSGCHHGGEIDGTGDYAGFNVVSGNSTGNTLFGQIMITNGNLWLTQDAHTPVHSNWTAAGENSIVAGSNCTALVYGNGMPGLVVSNNWWGAQTPPSGAFVNFMADNSSTYTLTGPPTVPFFDCGSLLDLAGRKGSFPQSMTGVNDTSCSQTLGMSESLVTDGLYDQAYDSACYYLSHCYAQADPYEAFGALGGSDKDTILTANGRASLKNFLLSVLPLRSDDDWFCQCVASFAGTIFLDTNYDREYMSLMKWLADNPRCTALQSALLATYYQERQGDYSLWLDTAHYPEKYDSSLLSMQQMGLDTVLKISATEGVSPGAIGTQILLNAHITENPFTNATNVSLLIGREAWVTIGVYNILGNQIAGAGYTGVFEQGSRIMPLDLDASPPGIYYIRITTANNETQTLKLVKE